MPTTPKPKKTKGKIGPLPVWGWAAVGAGVYAVYSIYQRHNANLAAAGATTVPLGVGTATNPGNGTPGAITTSTPSTSPTIAGLRAKFLAQATAQGGGGLTQAQALDAWNKFISGQALSGRAAQATKNIIGNLSAGGFIPAGVSTVVNITAPAAGATTAHTPTATTRVAQAYVPTSANKPADTRATTTPRRIGNRERPSRPTAATPARPKNTRPKNTRPMNDKILDAPVTRSQPAAPAGGGFDLNPLQYLNPLGVNPFHWLGF
jgi:hypothetical protein